MQTIAVLPTPSAKEHYEVSCVTCSAVFVYNPVLKAGWLFRQKWHANCTSFWYWNRHFRNRKNI